MTCGRIQTYIQDHEPLNSRRSVFIDAAGVLGFFQEINIYKMWDAVRNGYDALYKDLEGGITLDLFFSES